TPLSGVKFEDVFGPSAEGQPTGSRVRQRRARKRAKSRLHVENLEIRAVPAVTAGVLSSSLAGTPGNQVAVGEVVRYRIAVPILFDNTSYANLGASADLPAGLTFLGDGTAKAALVSDAGIVSDAAPAGSPLYVTGNEGTLGTVT